MIVLPREFSDAYEVTPNNSADLTPFGVRGLRVTVAGVVKVDIVGGHSGVTIPCAAGIDLHLPIAKVYATGTTATGIVALIG